MHLSCALVKATYLSLSFITIITHHEFCKKCLSLNFFIVGLFMQIKHSSRFRVTKIFIDTETELHSRVHFLLSDILSRNQHIMCHLHLLLCYFIVTFIDIGSHVKNLSTPQFRTLSVHLQLCSIFARLKLFINMSNSRI